MQINTPVLNLWEQQLECMGIMFDMPYDIF